MRCFLARTVCIVCICVVAISQSLALDNNHDKNLNDDCHKNCIASNAASRSLTKSKDQTPALINKRELVKTRKNHLTTAEVTHRCSSFKAGKFIHKNGKLISVRDCDALSEDYHL